MSKRLDINKAYRIWFGTWNNPEDMSKEGFRIIHTKLNARCTRGQLEQGEEEGTLHFQFVVFLKDKVRLAALHKTLPKVHWEPSESKAANEYVLKEDTRIDGPWEFGDQPQVGSKKKKVDWQDVWNKACEGKINEIDPWVRIVHYPKLKAIEKDHLKIKHSDHLRGIWIHGEYGTGKSRWFRDNFPDEKLYPKLCNKWWDGYRGQPIVIMDDIDVDHDYLAQQLKIWSDRYGCILETKGGAETSRYDWFVVTSQYHIDEIFHSEETRGALKRRFQEFEIEDIEQLRSIIDVEKYNK